MTAKETIIRLGKMSDKYKQTKVINETMQKIFGTVLSDSDFEKLNYQTREEFYSVLQQNKKSNGAAC